MPRPSGKTLSADEDVHPKGGGYEADEAKSHIGSAADGARYFIYKAFLAVSASAALFATVSITRPASARLVYGSPSRIGALFSARSGQALLAASRTKARLPVCGPRFTAFTGCVIVTGPACVTFECRRGVGDRLVAARS
jgi:hypothetical protein